MKARAATTASVTIYHNPNCSTSKYATAVAAEMGVAYNEVRYLKTPPTRAELERLTKMLEGPIEDLVRKDGKFKALGLDPEPLVGNRAAVVELLEAYPQLMQRPVLVRGDRAIIGRPKERVGEFLA